MSDTEIITRLEESVKHLGVDVKEVREDIKEIKEAIVGDGKPGLKTEMALTKQSIGRVWWWLGGISLSIITSAVWIVRSGLK